MRSLPTFSELLRPLLNEGSTGSDGARKVLLPRTPADELPPYREQPWIIDRQGYRKIDPSMTLVPASRL